MPKQLKYIILLLLTISSIAVMAQQRKIIQLSGIITTPVSELPVAYASITNISYNNQVFISNNDGYFSFVAHVGDTIRFTSVGYEPAVFVVPNVADDKFTASIKMKSLVIELPAVTPYPWASYEDYLNDFMALGGEDPVANVRRNLSPEALAALAAIVPRDANEIQSYNSLQRHRNMTNKNINQRYNNPFLNPFNWAQFINQIKRGDYSREKLKY